MGLSSQLLCAALLCLLVLQTSASTKTVTPDAAESSPVKATTQAKSSSTKNAAPSPKNVDTSDESAEVGSMKVNFVKNIEKVMKQKAFQLYEGITLESVAGAERQSSGRSVKQELEALPQDAAKKDEKLNFIVKERLGSLLASRSMKISLDAVLPGGAIRLVRAKDHNNAVTVALELPREGRSMDEARTRLKKWLGLFLLFKYNIVIFGVLTIFFIASLAGKAFLISKLALFVSSILGINKLVHRNDYGSYTYAAYPGAGYGQQYGAQGYGSRSIDAEAPKLKAFRAHDDS